MVIKNKCLILMDKAKAKIASKIFVLVILLIMIPNITLCEENIFFAQQKELTETVKKIKPISVFVMATFTIKDSTGRIIGETNQYGSGFLFDTAQANGIRLITNKHILISEKTKQVADRIRAKINVASVKKPVLVDCIISGIHQEYDLAVLTLGEVITEDENIPTQVVRIQGREVKYIKMESQPISENFFIKENNEVEEGMAIFYIGYPLGLGGMEYKCFPLTREGSVSQVMPDNNYFIIDALSSHGNSGSPVLGLTKNGWKVIGILQGNYNDFDAEGKPDNAGLSIVISGVVINDYINKLIAEKKIISLWS